MKIKYILSDLDGVIRKFPIERDSGIEERFKLPLGTLFKTAFGNKELLDKAVCGHITDEEWRSGIAKALEKLLEKDTAKLVIEEWSNFSGIVDNDYLNYLESQFPSVPIVVLTNGTTRLQSDLAKLGIQHRFLKIFNSADIGFCKPDKSIFEHVLKALACEPSDVFFVDDSLSHVKTAQDLGMQVHHYKSLNEFKSLFDHELPFIRRAAIQDAEGIHLAHMKSIQEICSKDHSPEEIKAWGHRPYKEVHRHKAILNNIVYVVEFENCIEGFLHFHLLENKKDAYVYGLYLTKKVQGHGVAKKLIKILFDTCIDNNIEKIDLSSTLTAHDFYQNMGFVNNGLLGYVLFNQVKIQCYQMTKVFSKKGIELKVLPWTSANEKLVQNILERSPKYYLAISGELPKENEGALFFEEAPKGFSDNKLGIGIYYQNKLIGVNDNLLSYPDVETIYLGLLIFTEEFKNKGFGSESYKLIEKIFKTNTQYKKIILSVVHTNDNAFKFWEKVGFKRTGVTKPYKIGDFKTIVAMMEKRINE